MHGINAEVASRCNGHWITIVNSRSYIYESIVSVWRFRYRYCYRPTKPRMIASVGLCIDEVDASIDNCVQCKQCVQVYSSVTDS